jgi:hypothetical protein
MQALTFAESCLRYGSDRARRAGLFSGAVAANTSSQRATTPPKGRPTRPRDASYYRKRVFGSTAQWIAVAIILVLAFVVLMMVAY